MAPYKRGMGSKPGISKKSLFARQTPSDPDALDVDLGDDDEPLAPKPNKMPSGPPGLGVGSLPMDPRRIIIDTDPGQDDAVAILLALASPELEVLGITTVAGNVPQPLVTENALKLVELLYGPEKSCEISEAMVAAVI